MKINFALQIIEIERLNSSTNGNPRFKLYLDDKLSVAYTLETQRDSMLNYYIGNPMYKVGDWVKIETSRSNRIVSIKPAKAPDYLQRGIEC